MSPRSYPFQLYCSILYLIVAYAYSVGDMVRGDKYDYICVYCGTSLGDKIDKTSGQNVILV